MRTPLSLRALALAAWLVCAAALAAPPDVGFLPAKDWTAIRKVIDDQLQALKAGRTVDVPVYDFVSHSRRAETRRVTPAPVTVVEGILVFVDPAVRRLLDIKIFVDTDSDLRVFRRIRRDMEHRGRTFQQIREQYYRTVRPMHVEFVEPSKRYADLIIPEGGENSVALDLVVSKVRSLLPPTI